MKREDIYFPDNGMMKQEMAKIIFDYVNPLPEIASRIIEIGTGFGESSKFFSQMKPNSTIYTIDAFGLYGDGRVYDKMDHDRVKNIIDKHPANVVQILGDSSKIELDFKCDILYIDGNHTYEGCMKDFYQYAKLVVTGGIIIFDDYHQPNNPTNGVKQVVEEICSPFENSHMQLLYTGIAAIVRKNI